MSIVTYKRGDKTALTKNFTRDEFECQCKKCDAQMIDQELVDKLQRIRDVLGVKLKVTSGYRCITHNAKVHGSSHSKHLYGFAADWRTLDRVVNPVALGIIAQAVGFGGIGIYWHSEAAMCHADTRAGKATWLCTSPGVYPSTTYNSFILPTIRQGLYGLIFAATFQDCAPFETLRSIGTPDDLALWQGYLHAAANAAAEAGRDTPYYSPLQKLVYGALGMVRMVYAVCVPVLLAAALAAWLAGARRSFGKGREPQTLLWLILAGLLASALLRCFMIAFVMVASFDIPTNTMYLASVHPLLLLFGGVSVLTAWEKRREH